MAEWESFAVAQVGAAAVLAGLIFVGVSVNLDRRLAMPNLPGRAGEALVVLLALLVAASLLLVPHQTASLIGVELLVIGVLAWLAIVGLQLRTRGAWEREHPRPYVLRVVLSQVATLPFVLAGIGVLWRGEGSLAWLAVGTIGAFAVAFVNAWVLLAEINR